MKRAPSDAAAWQSRVQLVYAEGIAICGIREKMQARSTQGIHIRPKAT
jgi:hypothetical protein